MKVYGRSNVVLIAFTSLLLCSDSSFALTRLRVGLAGLSNEKEKTVGTKAKYLRLDVAKDRDLLEAAQRDLAVKQIRQKPYAALEAIRVVLGHYTKEPKDPREFVDERFMRKIDESGFIEALYR